VKAHPKSPSAASFRNATKDHGEMVDLYVQLRDARARLLGSTGKMEVLPDDISLFLSHLLKELQRGNSVTILHDNAELSTFEASRLLGMSRQFLIGLLDKGEIPYHRVGTHRRLYTRDVLAYRVKRDSLRRKVLGDLARKEISEGTYDRFPDDFIPRQ